MTALVTGAAGDIGGAIAEALGRRGYALCLSDHPDAGERLEATAAGCRELGAKTRVIAFEVTDQAAVRAAPDSVGPLRALVNSAGYQGVFLPIDGYPLEDARR